MNDQIKSLSASGLLEILKFPDPALLSESEPVKHVTENIVALADRMAETMLAEPGLGLAAPQVGVLLRVIVVDIGSGEEHAGSETPHVVTMINPEVAEQSGETVAEEGCLSLPGIYEDLPRPARVKVRYTDLGGQICQMDLKDLAARCVMHEIDHLDGILLWDRVGAARRFYLKLRHYKLSGAGG